MVSPRVDQYNQAIHLDKWETWFQTISGPMVKEYRLMWKVLLKLTCDLPILRRSIQPVDYHIQCSLPQVKQLIYTSPIYPINKRLVRLPLLLFQVTLAPNTASLLVISHQNFERKIWWLNFFNLLLGLLLIHLLLLMLMLNKPRVFTVLF